MWSSRATGCCTSGSRYAARDRQWLRLRRREVESGLGDEALDETGSVSHPFEAGLDQDGQLVDAVFGEVRQGPLEVRPDGLDGLSSGA